MYLQLHISSKFQNHLQVSTQPDNLNVSVITSNATRHDLSPRSLQRFVYSSEWFCHLSIQLQTLESWELFYRIPVHPPSYIANLLLGAVKFTNFSSPPSPSHHHLDSREIICWYFLNLFFPPHPAPSILRVLDKASAYEHTSAFPLF